MNEQRINTVLIVDNDVTNIKMLTFILKDKYIVYAVKSGQEAIEMAAKLLPDVILLDILMPKMDGYEVLLKLKESEKTKNIPVIFVSGLSEADDEEKGLLMGASDYITKPFSSAIVKLRVAQQINFANQEKNNCGGWNELLSVVDGLLKDALKYEQGRTPFSARVLSTDSGSVVLQIELLKT